MERAFPFQLKSIDDITAGSFEGLASVYGNVDHGGDVVLQGAFSETLRKSNVLPILWSHDPTEPVGLGTLEDSAAGLKIEGRLDLDVQAGRDAYSRLKKRIVRGLSIGYRSVKDSVQNGVRHLHQIELFEVSLTVLPMNPAATVTRIKSQLRSVKDYEQWLRQAGGFSKAEAKRLAAHGWDAGGDDDDDDELDEIAAWLREQRTPVPR